MAASLSTASGGGAVGDVVGTPALVADAGSAEDAAGLTNFDLDEIRDAAASTTSTATAAGLSTEQQQRLALSRASSFSETTPGAAGGAAASSHRAAHHHHHHTHHAQAAHHNAAGDRPSTVYGLTAERARQQATVMAKEALKTQWQSAGGVIAAEVRASPMSIGGSGSGSGAGGFAAWSGSPSLGAHTTLSATASAPAAATALERLSADNNANKSNKTKP